MNGMDGGWEVHRHEHLSVSIDIPGFWDGALC